MKYCEIKDKNVDKNRYFMSYRQPIFLSIFFRSSTIPLSGVVVTLEPSTQRLRDISAADSTNFDTFFASEEKLCILQLVLLAKMIQATRLHGRIVIVDCDEPLSVRHFFVVDHLTCPSKNVRFRNALYYL